MSTGIGITVTLIQKLSHLACMSGVIGKFTIKAGDRTTFPLANFRNYSDVGEIFTEIVIT